MKPEVSQKISSYHIENVSLFGAAACPTVVSEETLGIGYLRWAMHCKVCAFGPVVTWPPGRRACGISGRDSGHKCYLFAFLKPQGNASLCLASIAPLPFEQVLGACLLTSWLLADGVPQGLVLFPVLFNIHMKPLDEVTKRFKLQCHWYTDDHSSISRYNGISRCLEQVMIWRRTNKPKVSPDKMEILLMGSNTTLRSGITPVLDRVALPLKAQSHSFGVSFWIQRCFWMSR